MKMSSYFKCKNIYISSSKFSVYFAWKNLLFLFYTSTFTKYLYQFIYSIHLFNKIFIILLIFIIHSLTIPLSHKPTATITTTITTQPPLPPSSETKEKLDQPTHTDQPTYRSTHTKNQIQHQINQHRSTHMKNQIQHQINQHWSTHTKKNQCQSKRHHLHASTPPRLHTYPDQPNQPRPTATITISHHQPSTRST